MAAGSVAAGLSCHTGHAASDSAIRYSGHADVGTIRDPRIGIIVRRSVSFT
ncbi:hypothetical protein MAHJHV51_41760 [Mycobacterium avium subsp. hominissuis]